MQELIMLCDFTILDDFKYDIYENGDLVLNAFVDFVAPIKDFVKKGELYQSKIVVMQKEKNILEIHKHIQTILSENLYTIFLNNKIYTLKDRKSYKVPDFYIKLPNGTLSIDGMINLQHFNIYFNNSKCATIKGSIEKNQKKYVLKYENIFNDSREIFLSCLLILDNLYHDY